LNCFAGENSSASSAAIETGKECLEKEDIAGALAAFTKAIDLDRRNAQAFISRACAYKRSGDEGKASADISEAIRLDPKAARVYFIRNWAYGRDREIDRMLNYVLRSPPENKLHVAPDNPAEFYFPLSSVELAARGSCHYYMGEWKLAIDDIDEVIRLKPREAAGYSCRGAVYVETGEYDKAIADLSDSIRLDPKIAEPYAVRGYAYAEKGDFAKAEAESAKTVALAPNFSYGVFCRAYVLWRKGERAAADNEFAEAVRIEASQKHDFEVNGLRGRLDEAETLTLAYLGFYELATDDFRGKFKITLEQKKALKAIAADLEYQNICAMRTERKSSKPTKNETKFWPVKSIDYSPALAKQAQARIKDCLTVKQWATYKQWKFTPNADRVIWHPEQFADLKTTDLQRDKIAQLRKACREPDLPYPNELLVFDDGIAIPKHVADKTADMKNSGRASEKYDYDREQRIARENGEKLLAVLTPQQQEALINQLAKQSNWE
jgi:tetratricopeptide (TPR) repeat protein